MSLSSRLSLGLKTLEALGPFRVGNYALYRLQLSSGYLYRQTRDHRRFTQLADTSFRIAPLLKLPARDTLRAVLGAQVCRTLQSDADKILTGRVRLFGGDPVPLDLGNKEPKAHWTEIEKSGGANPEKDIKWTWEAGRFGWATTLARAYWLTGDEKYPAFYWKSLETFLEANPPYQGLQWTSGQEVALRMISILFCAQVFTGSIHSTPERMLFLGRTIASHAGRIRPGMTYARAQNNNHLLSEAAGLLTAGLALKSHPLAAGWRALGQREFHKGIASQIAADGGYTQNSTNYHRLMLQLALWVDAIQQDPFPEKSCSRLAAATRWLMDMLDDQSGGVPNLGPNDGAYILPLSTSPIWDFRPVVQAASKVYLRKAPLAAGYWDEMGLWLTKNPTPEGTVDTGESSVKTVRLDRSWAYFRVARYSARPGHADQLHVDIWWRGMNLALDPGTYLYNADPPWDNALSRTCTHNTITVNDQDQMTRAGRFLWLDWAQARLLGYRKASDGGWERLSAEHDGYRRLGVLHQRSLTGYQDGRWRVEDNLLAQRKQDSSREYSIRLQWLLPDCPWSLKEINNGAEILLETLNGQVKLNVDIQKDALLAEGPKICLVRAGEIVYGEGTANPILGWFSPTYATKIPALSFSFTVNTSLPIVLISDWHLSEPRG